jgi:hypothetical protein
MTEEEFRKQLRLEGKFGQFKARVRELREEGLSPSESWYRGAAEFGYEPRGKGRSSTESIESDEGPPPEDADALQDLLAQTEGEPTNFTADVRWAYYRVEDQRASPADAPSPGAWSLLHWARSNRAKFLGDLVLKVLSKAEAEEEARKEKDGEDCEELDEIDDIYQTLLKPPWTQAILECPGCGAELKVLPGSDLLHPDQALEARLIESESPST